MVPRCPAADIARPILAEKKKDAVRTERSASPESKTCVVGKHLVTFILALFFCGIGIFIVPFGNAANGWTNGKLLKSRKKVLFSGKAGLFVYRVAAPIPNVDTIVLFALLLLC